MRCLIIVSCDWLDGVGSICSVFFARWRYVVQVGIQGEYIAQLLKEVKQRPIYLVDEEQSKL
ncbi:MAG: hypothetical protein ACJAQ6_002567 [Arenicella sp.]|jgi:hypothetical protein